MQLNGEAIFILLLKEICDSFLIKQYGCDVRLKLNEFTKSFYVKNLLEEIDIIFKVPFYAILNSKAAEFLLVYYPVYNYASENFLEALIDHLVIEIANCVAYVTLVNFSFLYSFRQTLYRSKFLSLRNFEQFKNNLIWQVRIKIYIQRPTSFYSSSYRLFLLRTTGIYTRTIYANRPQYFNSLTKFPLFVVTIVELKDFIGSRFDELVYFLSKGLRFILTSVLGQFIGLVWRGIREGLKK
nr:cheY-like family protein [Chrysochromulina parva]AUS84335.1 cheY-like family protein [Chrysochromulina parva]